MLIIPDTADDKRYITRSIIQATHLQTYVACMDMVNYGNIRCTKFEDDSDYDSQLRSTVAPDTHPTLGPKHFKSPKVNITRVC